MADCLTLLLNGDILTGITCTWTNVIGLWFYAIMLAAFEVSIFIKYENSAAPSFFGVFIGMLMLALLPAEAWTIPIGILIFNTAVVIYNVLRLRD